MLAEPCFATLDANISSPAQSYINTKLNASMLNITFWSSDANVNVSGLIITLNSTNTVADLRADVARIIVYRDVDGNGVINGTDLLLGTNSTSNETNTTQITFGPTILVSSGSSVFLVIQAQINSSASTGKKISFSIGSNASFLANDTVNATGFNSTQAQIQDVHANATLTPRYIDTGIINQTIYYNITPTGTNGIQNITITLPSGVEYVNNTLNVERNGGILTTTDYTNSTTTSVIRIFLAQPRTENHRIIFNANTTGTIGPIAVNSTLDGSNLTGVLSDYVGNLSYLTVQNIINVRAVNASKNAAYLNGSDYWEFIFDVNSTAPNDITGLLQFKMANWTNPQGYTIPVSNSASNISYVTLRNTTSFGTNATYTYNVTNEYNLTSGISFTMGPTAVSYLFYLRVLIPSSQYSIPVSSSWWTTYSMIFRSTP
jgi:hypothetical protein